MRRNIPQRTELLSLVFALLLVLFIVSLSYRAWAAFGRYSEQLANTQQAVDGANGLLSSIKDAETGQRGYLITGEDRYLEPYQHAVAEMPATLAALSRAVAADPDQAQAVKALGPLVQGKMDELRQTMELRRDRGEDAARAVVLTDRGKDLMDQIRGRCAEIQAAAYRRQAREAAEVRASANQLGWVGTLGSGMLFALLLLSTLTIRRRTRLRQRLIHDLQESEERTRLAQDWLQMIIRSIGDGVIVTDAAGKVTLLNSVAQSLTGWTQEEANGLPLEQIFAITNEDTGAPAENPVNKALREGRVVGLANHTQLETKDGRRLPIDDSAAPIRDAAGKITGVVLVFRDISERVRHAKLLERTNVELQHFAYAASHDLREPLRTIIIYAEMLQLNGAHLDTKNAEWLNLIVASSHRMNQLIDALLDYAKIGEGAAESLAPIGMEEMLASVIDSLRGTIEENQAVLTHDALPVIAGDEVQFKRLFQNLIENALKYRRDEIPRIHVSAKLETGEWIFSIADNGQGIATQHQTQIFDLFRRLHGQDHPGSGIGLATCKKVVERFGGRIWVESEVGQGSRFLFTVPVIQRDHPFRDVTAGTTPEQSRAANPRH